MFHSSWYEIMVHSPKLWWTLLITFMFRLHRSRQLLILCLLKYSFHNILVSFRLHYLNNTYHMNNQSSFFTWHCLAGQLAHILDYVFEKFFIISFPICPVNYFLSWYIQSCHRLDSKWNSFLILKLDLSRNIFNIEIPCLLTWTQKIISCILLWILFHPWVLTKPYET